MKVFWKATTLGDSCDMYQPKTISAKEMSEEGEYLVYGANGVIGRYDQFNHEEPQLLITCRGATCGSVNVSEPFSWVTGNAMVVRPKDDSISLKFLEYLFRGGIEISKAITGAAQPQITRTNLAPLEFSYPSSLSEQDRIVAILDEAFDGIASAKANAEKNLQNARALFESHLQSVFTERGEGWEEKPLEEVATIVNGFAFKSSDFSPSGETKCIKITNVGVREFVCESGSGLPKEFYNKFASVAIPAGSIVIALTRTIISSGLKVALVASDYDNALLNQRVAAILPRIGGVSLPFLFTYLSSQDVANYVTERVNTLMQPNLSIVDLREMPIPVPSVSQQEEITGRLESLVQETRNLDSLYQQKLTALDDLKKSLLHQAFSGQL